MKNEPIPYKIYLEESEMPKAWYNLRADMKNKPAPLLNPETLKPATFEELSKVFCDELARQELDDTTRFIEIPEAIRQGHIAYVINTKDISSSGNINDGHTIRQCATENNVTMFTALDTVKVLLDVLEETTLTISTIDA